MVSGMKELSMYTNGAKESFTRLVQKEYGKPVQQVGHTGVNYAQYDGGAKANYAQFDTYKSPVTTGRVGDKFDMMM